MDINDDYKITCELANGSYLYKLFYNDEMIYEYVDKYKPNELPRRSGNIKRLMDKINYNIINEKELKKQKIKDLDKIISDLTIDLKNDEIYFDDFQMTNLRVYTKNNNILFNFIIEEVSQNGKLFIIKFKNNIEEFELEDTIDNIIKELNTRYLINTSIVNYKFIFKTLVSLVIENANK